MEPLLSNNAQTPTNPVDSSSLSNNLSNQSCDSSPHFQAHYTSSKLSNISLDASRQGLLRSQILTYKQLIRNIKAPQRRECILDNPHFERQAHHTLSEKAVSNFRSKTDKQQQLKSMINPTSFYKNHSKEDLPSEPDYAKFVIDKRKNDIDHWLEKDDLELKTRNNFIIENKFIGVKDFYKNMFTKISERLKRENRSLNIIRTNLLERSFFRREKLHKLSDPNGKDRSSGHMKTDNDRKKKQRHRQIMQNIKNHKEQLFQFHKRKLKDRKKQANQVKQFLENKRKEKEDLEEKRKIARLKQLKAKNVEEYLELVEEEKKTKIKELLSQTNRFLKELGAKVLIQKGGSSQKQNNGDDSDPEQNNLKDIFQASNTVYYNLTHSMHQQVSKQPSILSGGELKNYQINGLEWLVSLYINNLNGILADEMGLGKTIQTIALFSYLIQYKKNFGPFLIVAPLSTISNWMAEFEKWAPSIRKIVYKGNPQTRNEIIKVMKTTKWNVCITTYDFILKDRLKLNKESWKYIVIDEGHKMKNAKSKFASILGTQYQSDHRLLLTGTPLQNNLQELWALLNFLLPKVFNSCDDFEKWFSMAIYKNTGDESVQLDEEQQLLIINRLHQVLRPFLLRRVKKEVYSQLPDKKEHVIKVDMSAWQKLIYDNISKKTALEFVNNTGKISKTTLTNLMMQLRKCCNHPYLFLKNFDDIGYHEWIIRSSGKFELIDRLLPKLKKFGHRLLIFTQMTHLMDIMQIYFEYKGVKHLRLDGSTKADDRQERMRLFNEPNSIYDVFLLSTRAGGLGLNLQTADTVIIFDSDWNPQMDLQAQDRVHRIGQEKEVIVLRLITNNSIQEHILQRTAFKMNLNELFIQGGLYNLNSSQAERRKKIEDILLKRKLNEDENQEEEIQDDDMINQYIRRSDEEYEEFGRMDQQRYKNNQRGAQQIHESIEKKSNCRLMKPDEIPAWFIDAPRKTESYKQYGRGNRARKQINYSDEVIDQQLFGMLEEDQNGASYSNEGVEVPNFRPPKKERPQDIEKLIAMQKESKIHEQLFEQEEN